jgi:hypothetical protein
MLLSGIQPFTIDSRQKRSGMTGKNIFYFKENNMLYQCIMTKTGQAFATWDLYNEYNFTDLDGTQPDWGEFYQNYLKQKAQEQPQ